MLTQILRHGRVRRARLGIAGEQIPLPQRLKVHAGLSQDAAVRVVEVMPDGPAQGAGIQPGDVVLSLDDAPVTGVDDIARLLDGAKIGQRVSVRLLRQAAQIITLDIVPTERQPH